MAGVTSTGFIAKTTGDLLTDLQAAARRVYGSAVNVDPRSRVGQMLSLVADALAEPWAVAAVLSATFDPSSASGVLLDNLCALTGTYRAAAAKSAVTLLAIGTAGTALPAGRRARVTGTSTIFETLALGTIASASSWVTATPYAEGAIVTSGGGLWRAVAAGTSGATAPTGAGPTHNDGTVTWAYQGAGTAFVLVAAEATVTGPLQGFAGSATTIETPVAGWAAVTNPLDAVPGRNLESDPDLRLRRALEIGGIGSSPLDAVRAEVSAVAGVSNVVVFENTSDVTVGTIGPHGIEVLVEGGVDTVIADAIKGAKAAGIGTYGTTVLTRALSNGNPVDIRFSRPTSVNIWVTVSLLKDPATYPLDGDEQVKAALVAYGDTRELGRDVVASALSGAIFRAVPGVLDVTILRIGTAPSPGTNVTIPLTIRQRADFDTSRCVVSSYDGSL